MVLYCLLKLDSHLDSHLDVKSVRYRFLFFFAVFICVVLRKCRNCSICLSPYVCIISVFVCMWCICIYLKCTMERHGC